MTWADSWAQSGPRNRIVLATASVDLEEKFKKATDGACLSLPLGPLPASPAALFAHLKAAPPPEVIVLDSGSDPEPALELAARFDQQVPNISVIVVSDLGLEIGLEAMRAGVRDLLHPTADIADIRLVLDRAFEATQIKRRTPTTPTAPRATSRPPAG